MGDTKDILKDVDIENDTKVNPSISAFKPVKPLVDSFISPLTKQEVITPPFLPTSSPPTWYSSLISSLYTSSSEQNNNHNKLERNTQKGKNELKDLPPPY